MKSSHNNTTKKKMVMTSAKKLQKLKPSAVGIGILPVIQFKCTAALRSSETATNPLRCGSWIAPSIGFCLSPIDVSERLAVSIEHFKAAWNLLNGPWCWESSHGNLFVTCDGRQGAVARGRTLIITTYWGDKKIQFY